MSKIKYNSNMQRWELVTADNTVIDSAVGLSTDSPWDLTWSSTVMSEGGSVDVTVTSGTLLQGRTAVCKGTIITGTMPDNGDVTIVPSSTGIAADSGYYNSIYIEGDPNLIPENVKQGVTIFGVAGTHTGGESIDWSQVTATAADVLEGTSIVTADGVVSGTMPNKGSVSITLTDETQELGSGYYSSIVVPAKPEEGITLPSGITVKPSDVLAGIYYIDEYGNKQEGTMPNRGSIDVTLTDNSQTLESGYYDSITIPAAPPGVDTSQATSFGSSDLVEGQKGINKEGTLVEGSLSLYEGEFVNVGYGSPYEHAQGIDLEVSIPQGAYKDSRAGLTLYNLLPDNIKAGVTISGLTNITTGTFTADATATASDILKDKTAYVNGSKVTGTLEGAELSNLTAENIKYGVTINGITGTFTEFGEDQAIQYGDPATPETMPKGTVAWVNGELVQGNADSFVMDVFQMENYYTISNNGDSYILNCDIPVGFHKNSVMSMALAAEGITPENIKKGVTVFGAIEGSYEGESIDLSGVTAEAKYVLSGQKFIDSNGNLVAGTAFDARTSYGRMEYALTFPSNYGDYAYFTLTPVAALMGSGTAIITPNTEFFIELQRIDGQTITPSKSAITISGDCYLRGNIVVNPIPDAYVDTSDANATASEILKDKTAYVNGQKVTGTLEVTQSSGDGMAFYKCASVGSEESGGGGADNVSREPISVDDMDVGSVILLEYDDAIGEYRGTFSEYNAMAVSGIAALVYNTDSSRFDRVNTWVYYHKFDNSAEDFKCFANPSPAVDASSAEICAATWYYLDETLVDEWFAFEVAEQATAVAESGDSGRSLYISGCPGSFVDSIFTHAAGQTGGDRVFVSEKESAVKLWLNPTYEAWTIGNDDGTIYHVIAPGESVASNPDITLEEFTNVQWMEIANMLGESPTVTIPESSGDSGSDTSTTTWSGYKMVWSDGGTTETPEYPYTISDGYSVINKNYKQTEYTDTSSEYISEDGLVKITEKLMSPENAWQWMMYILDPELSEDYVANIGYPRYRFSEGPFFEDRYSSLSMLGGRAWLIGLGSSNHLMDSSWCSNGFTVSYSEGETIPAGWQETTELVEGLEAKGYTPEVGKVYNADTTASISLYPSQSVAEQENTIQQLQNTVTELQDTVSSTEEAMKGI